MQSTMKQLVITLHFGEPVDPPDLRVGFRRVADDGAPDEQEWTVPTTPELAAELTQLVDRIRAAAAEKGA